MKRKIGFFLAVFMAVICRGAAFAQDESDAVHDYMVEANRLVSEQRFEEAVQTYGKVLEIKQDGEALAKYYFDMGVHYAGQGDNAGAVRFFTKCLEIDPDHRAAQVLLNLIETASRDHARLDIQRQSAS